MPSLYSIRTRQLLIRPFRVEDAESAHAWFSDAEVMRFIPSGPDCTLADSRRRIAGYIAHQERFGFSKGIVLESATGDLVGDCGLYHLPDGERIELGFRFRRDRWGRGYAVEVGRAWIRRFEELFPGKRLFADVHADHLRSQRVLEKLGFRPSHGEIIHGMPMLICVREPGSPAPDDPQR